MASVTVKPLILLFVERTWIMLSCVIGFSNAGRTVYPHSSYVFSVVLLLVIESVEVNRLFNSLVLGDVNESLVNCFDASYLKDLLVTSLKVTLLVSLSGEQSELEWSFDSCLLFETVG